MNATLSLEIFSNIETDGTNFLTVSPNGAVWKTTDGITWTNIAQLIVGQQPVAQAVLFYFGGNFYVVGNFSVSKSSDTGVTWTQVATIGGSSNTQFIVNNGSYFLTAGLINNGNFTSSISVNYVAKVTSFTGTPPYIYIPNITTTNGTPQFYMRTL
jgi:hypothetical protein